MVFQLEDYRKDKQPAIAKELPPQAVEIEEQVIGGLLIDPNAIARIADTLKPEAFYFTPHADIYRTILKIHSEDLPVDLMTVAIRLKNDGLLERVGGQKKLAGLFDTTVSAVNIDLYAEVIAEKYKRRKLIQVCQEAIRLAHTPAESWTQVLAKVEDDVFRLTESASQKGLRDIGDILVEEFVRVEDLARGDEQPGYMTGFYDLDAMTKGLKPQELVIVAGRPAMGKSAFAAAIARNMAAKSLPVAFFSLEMSSSSVVRRLWSAESQIESSRISTGKIAAKEWEDLGHAGSRLSDMPIAIDESMDVTPTHILSQCRKFKAEKGGLGLVLIDYLHLMLDGSDDEVRELGKITRACKKMARSLNAPVMLLSQLNRVSESKSNKRPSLAELRGSGSIEQDADIVLMLYRDEYYNPDSPDRGVAEVIIAKHRNGPTGTVKLLFEGEYSRFRNLARRDF